MNCLHHIVYWLFPSGAAVAEWVAAVATGVLACFAWIPLFALRKSLGDAAKAQQDKKRADQFDRLKWMDGRFNSPAMLVARSKLGQERLDGIPRGMPRHNAERVISFLMQIAQLSEKSLLALNDIGVAYGAYIYIVWFEFRNYFEDDNRRDKFVVLAKLRDRLAATNVEFEFKPSASRTSDAGMELVRSRFWVGEAALHP
jgi:hypothetical protein